MGVEIWQGGGGGAAGPGTGDVEHTRRIDTTAPLTGGGDLSANRTIAIPAATALADGYLTAADWSTFDAKLDPGIDTSDVPDSLNARYVTDAELVVLGNTSGTNTGDQTLVGLGGVPSTRTVNAHPLSADVTVTAGDVGLGSVDNTADSAKPVSTAQQTALNLKANIASPTFTGTVAGITSAMVGLGNVDNTSDANKPVSTAQQTALNLKADLASPTFTGTVSGITKTMVGLGNVDNTSDAAKPVSTATQTALNLKLDSNVAITPATKTKITYDADGLITSGADATTADIADSLDKRYVTDAQLAQIGAAAAASYSRTFALMGA